ncbi:MAG: hypothetical protein A3K19_14565 [Lentisphaerae bacterium RIFOXYB12_FULL_65_16]|nr:MAG: hypothetical protein A3K18_18610 [Lentisphaerae bacterium RIFOXYA12_64_32]OGV87445.1 MAG: hypothetical protein A3K19_14565 [Lentisphaerae bacterium RIFOXYB12_FULL_65_16]
MQPSSLASPPRSGTTRVAVLAENTVATRDLVAEHGLAFWVQAGSARLLFDTGQGLVLGANARQLGVDLRQLDGVVLSHGHYDHTGGVTEVLGLVAKGIPVHAHPDALQPKFLRHAAGVRDIGIPAPRRAALLSASCSVVLSREPREVVPGVWTTGEVPRRHPEETIEAGFCLDSEGHRPDPLKDDQALFFGTAVGTVVLLGCAHAGVINTLDHIRDLTNGKPVHAVLGGMHLRNTSEARLQWTVAALQRFEIGRLGAMHCTGVAASVALWNAFPGRCVACGVGSTFEF